MAFAALSNGGDYNGIEGRKARQHASGVPKTWRTRSTTRYRQRSCFEPGSVDDPSSIVCSRTL